MKCLSILYHHRISNVLHPKYVLCSFGNGLVKTNWCGVQSRYQQCSLCEALSEDPTKQTKLPKK